MDCQIRKVAFYLPQFYRTNINDKYWHPGFTDWLNVARAKPRFKGHHQPQLPTELGFYDQSYQGVVDSQVLLAKDGNLTAFCVYHYWFNNRPVLEKPLLNIRESCERLNFQFCMSWANENWTRSWDGSVREVILKQDYTAYSIRRHIDFLKPFLLSSAYLRVDSSPFFAVYRPNDIPDLARFLLELRMNLEDSICSKVHLCATQTSHSFLSEDELRENGFDSCLLFEPNPIGLKPIRGISASGSYNRYEYTALRELSLKRFKSFKFKKYGCIMPSWDNTARRESDAQVIQNLKPHEYGNWLARLTKEVGKEAEGSDELIFINAWNEWAEGCHLEPDLLNGRSFLEQTRTEGSALQSNGGSELSVNVLERGEGSSIERQYKESRNIWLEGVDVINPRRETEFIVAGNTSFIVWGSGLAAVTLLQDQGALQGRVICFTQTSPPSNRALLGLNFLSPQECIEGVHKAGGSKVILIASQYAEEIASYLSKHQLKRQKHFHVVGEATSIFRTSTQFCFTENYTCYLCGSRNGGSLMPSGDVRCSRCGAHELVNSLLHELRRDRVSFEQLYTWKWGGTGGGGKANPRDNDCLNFNIFTKMDITHFSGSDFANYVNLVVTNDIARAHNLSMASHSLTVIDVEFVKENGENWFRRLIADRTPQMLALWVFGESRSLIKLYGYICGSDSNSLISCQLSGARQFFGLKQDLKILKLSSSY